MRTNARNPDPSVERFLEYVSERAKREPQRSPSGWRRIARKLVPRRLRPVVSLALTRVLMPVERVRARTFARTGVRLHLGSGKLRKPGWVNIDLAGQPVDLVWDLKYRLPFPNDTVEAVFHEHLLEHLPLEVGLSLTKECYRVLRAGGVLRIGVPHAEAYIQSYLSDPGAFLEKNRPGRPTRLLAIQEIFYDYGHRTMYDYETLALLCRCAGFTRVQASSFGESRYLEPSLDSEDRRLETLYVEALK